MIQWLLLVLYVRESGCRNNSIMVRLHSSTLFSVLRLGLLPALLLSLLYVFSLIKTKSEFIYHQRGILTEEMLSHTQQVIRKKPKYVCLSVAHYKIKNCKSSSEPITTAASTQEERTATTSAEPSPNKYNLMEETYGRKWSESPANMHLFSTDCTIGTIILLLQGFSKDKYVSFMT